MGGEAIVFAVDVFVSTLCVWLATKFSYVKIELNIIAGIVALTAVISLIPVLGWFLGLLVFLYLIVKVSRCKAVDALWVVLFTKLFSFMAAWTLMRLI